jgi:UV excision repair protein RAD23
MPIIQANPQILMQLISTGSLNIQGFPPQAPNMGGGGGGVQPPSTQPGQQVPQPTIELTEDDRANIDTIISMGFNEQQAIEAYMVCNKNVELAINYLFDSS